MRRWACAMIAAALIVGSALAAGAESDLYDPSIFIIEAKGAWRQELAEGYYADYECELYLDKIDSNDNRVADRLYGGAFWLSTKRELSDYLKKQMKKAKVKIDFQAGVEGVCDNLTVNLRDEYGRDPWQGYGIPGKGGETQPPEGALAAIATVNEAYLNIQASGPQGESVQHSDNQGADAEISYIIHVEPDPKNELAERKATIHLYTPEGTSATIKGVWRRIPGYPEDILKYAEIGKSWEMLDRHSK